MKIGILTYHCVINYGALLQAFALQEFLKGLGHKVEIIDYRPTYLVIPVLRYDRYTKKSFRNLLSLMLLKLQSFVPRAWKNAILQALGLKDFAMKKLLSFSDSPRRNGFENFISKRLNLSPKQFFSGDMLLEGYDAIIFGSDQIWNTDHRREDPVFFGEVATRGETLKIAYAASAGSATEKVGENQNILDSLKNFDAISVREQNLADVLKQKVDREIKVVLDPTLLADKSIWDKIAVPPKRERKYVLIYQVLPAPDTLRIARELAEQIDADVVSIWACSGEALPGSLMKETPEQFVGWIKNAACVVTTSFHGTAFSVIFEKPLYYISKGYAGENRPKQILQDFGLSDRIISEGTHPKFSEIDYSNVSLEGLRIASREFLENALSNVRALGGASPTRHQ